MYVIYNSKAKAQARLEMITDDARISNFLNPDEVYNGLVEHPTEDRAAIAIIHLEPVYYQGLPTQRYDYSIFFTDMEKAGAVDELPADWYPETDVTG